MTSIEATPIQVYSSLETSVSALKTRADVALIIQLVSDTTQPTESDDETSPGGLLPGGQVSTFNITYNPPTDPDDLMSWVSVFCDELLSIANHILYRTFPWQEEINVIFNDSNNLSIGFLVYFSCIIIRSKGTLTMDTINNILADEYSYQAIAWPEIVSLYVLPALYERRPIDALSQFDE